MYVIIVCINLPLMLTNKKNFYNIVNITLVLVRFNFLSYWIKIDKDGNGNKLHSRKRRYNYLPTSYQNTNAADENNLRGNRRELLWANVNLSTEIVFVGFVLSCVCLKLGANQNTTSGNLYSISRLFPCFPILKGAFATWSGEIEGNEPNRFDW